MIFLKTIKQRGMGLQKLFFIILLHLSPCFGAMVCLPNQRDALLEFGSSFVVNKNVRDSLCYGSASVSSYPKTASWNRSVDCCDWGGVTCDELTGNVIGLDLKCSWLQGILHSNSTLFRLRHLQMLDLASNDFLGSWIPPEINALEELTHLNLSIGNFSGLVPSELSHLTKLRSLDVSMNFDFKNVRPILRLEDTTLEGIAQNLTALRVLDLSWLDMSNALASSLTNLSSEMIFLSARLCGLGGEFPRNIFHLPNLRHLDFYLNEITGSLPESNWTTPLVFLDLSYARLRGRLPDSVGQLRNLKDLHLDSCHLTGILPRSLGNLTGMTSLKLSSNDLIGHVPSTLGNLKQLIVLDLQGNKLSGKVDFRLFSGMKDLQVLSLNVELSLDYESSNYSFPKLEELALPSGNLTRFPSFIRSLDRLRSLDLSSNAISGNVPSWFWNVSRDTLITLDLSGNHLTRFPSFIRSLDRLRSLDLSSNAISGNVPSWFWNVSRDTLITLDLSGNRIDDSFQFPWLNMELIYLRNNLLKGTLQVPPRAMMWFDVSDNNFSGTIPDSFCLLHSLSRLNLAGNNLFGTLPSCLGNSTNFEEFDLSDNNFHGEVPRFLANSTLISRLNLSYNSLEDTFPSWLGGSMLWNLDLKANKFHGTIGLSKAGIPFISLKILDISNNNFQGSWPTDFFLPSGVVAVDLSDNHFHGPLPLLPPSILFFSASNNKFTGEIPSLMCSATDLLVLNLSNNSLTGGTLPPCLINLSRNLSVLNLRMNKIGGIIPDIFGRGSGLRTLDLSRNRFEGSLPRSLQSCRQLEVLDLSNNLIEDTFPNWLSTLPELQVLILRSNKFHGIMNRSDGLNLFSKLRILDLSENDFSGLLPESYFKNLKAMISGGESMSYKEFSLGFMAYRDSVTLRIKGTDLELVRILSVFTSIDLSVNNFWGPVPTEIGNLKSLKGLNLSRNSLTGRIPTSLGNLTNLEWLDLSANKLDGTIPQQLADITSLAVLNLSENLLTGRIPSGKQFNTFNISSFSGNPGLCGFPLPNACSEADPPSSSRTDQETRRDQGEWLSWRRAMLIGYWPGLVLGISLGYIFLETCKPAWLANFMDRIEAKVMKMSRRKKKH